MDVWAVMKKEDAQARALFTIQTDAIDFAARLNDDADRKARRGMLPLPFSDMQTPQVWNVYAWRVPSDDQTFFTEE